VSNTHAVHNDAVGRERTRPVLDHDDGPDYKGREFLHHDRKAAHQPDPMHRTNCRPALNNYDYYSS
jgi:hypothetical protein